MSLGAADRQTSVHGEHLRIFQAISHRDAASAEAAMRDHIESSRENVLGNL